MLKKINLYTALFFISLLIGQQSLAIEASLSCKESLLGEFKDDYVVANDVLVTGEFIYPLDFVLKNLDLNQGSISQSLKGKSVLSLAEGVSGFLPLLIGKGISVKALDLWYHSESIPNNYSGDLMRDYVGKYGDHLIQGDARKIPVKDSSVDAVFSHMLLNNVSPVRQRAIIRDVIRVLKGGGEARLYGLDVEESFNLSSFLDNFSGVIEFSFKEINSELNFNGNLLDYDMNLLIIKKSISK